MTIISENFVLQYFLDFIYFDIEYFSVIRDADFFLLQSY